MGTKNIIAPSEGRVPTKTVGELAVYHKDSLTRAVCKDLLAARRDRDAAIGNVRKLQDEIHKLRRTP